MLISKLKNKLDSWNKQGRWRTRMIVEQRDGNQITVDGFRSINFCGNDYLALANHPLITASFIDTAKQYGVGSGSSSFVAGYFQIQQELENKFAEWLQVDKAIFFNSGYLANLGAISTLNDRDAIIFSDKLCHASLLDGIKLSRAKHYRYQHNSINHLTSLANNHTPTMIVTESVFSMEGDIAPITDLVALTKQFNAGLIIDDAHGIGVLGKHGGGICEYANINQQHFSCLVTPLGKAFNGMGAIVAGKKEIIEAILQFSGCGRYTTALPPAICGALIQSLTLVINETWRREKLTELINFFIQQALKRNLKLASTDLTPIKSIIIGENSVVEKIQKNILVKGFYISCIRPPTVPEHTARIRVSLNCMHTEKQIIDLLNLIVKQLDLHKSELNVV